MNKKPLNISEEAAVQMPMKTVASLIVIVALGTMGYFQIVERLNVADTRLQLMEKDLEENTEFRIKWPRGQLGSLPADSEQFMMIEDLYKSTDKLNKHIESMALNKVNIEFLRKQMDKVLEDIEKLKTQLELVKECKRVPKIKPVPVEFAELINMCMKLGVISNASYNERDSDPKVSYWTVLKEKYMKENPGLITLDNYKDKK